MIEHLTSMLLPVQAGLKLADGHLNLPSRARCRREN
jgi:hypothetical protein